MLVDLILHELSHAVRIAKKSEKYKMKNSCPQSYSNPRSLDVLSPRPRDLMQTSFQKFMFYPCYVMYLTFVLVHRISIYNYNTCWMRQICLSLKNDLCRLLFGQCRCLLTVKCNQNEMHDKTRSVTTHFEKNTHFEKKFQSALSWSQI